MARQKPMAAISLVLSAKLTGLKASLARKPSKSSDCLAHFVSGAARVEAHRSNFGAQIGQSQQLCQAAG
jgi:hypothetical protein